MNKITWLILISFAAFSLAIFGCGPKETGEEVTEETTEEAVEETGEVTEETTEKEGVDIEEMTAEIKTMVEEVNTYQGNHNTNNTSKTEFAETYFGYAEKFEDLKTVYSIATPTEKQKESFDKLIIVLDKAIDSMSKYSEGAEAPGMDGMLISMDAAKLWEEVNTFFGIELT